MLRDVIARKRKYAGSWAFPNQEVAELGVARQLIESLGLSDSWRIRSRGQGNDPPDCEAENSEGRRIGIEVTELVDEEHAGGPAVDWANWDRDEVLATICQRLVRKDSPTKVKGDPYDSYVLIICTDEAMLTAARLREMLDGFKFGPFDLIDRAWILRSYIPDEGYQPVRLELRGIGD